MARLGEIVRPQPEVSCCGVPSPYDVLSDRIGVLLPEVGSRLILEAPVESLSGEEISVDISMRKMPCGIYGVELPVPEGFLRFVSMRMSGWGRSVGSLLLPGSAGWECQLSSEEGIAGCPERPRVYLDSGMLRGMGSKKETDTLASFRCCCVPTISSEGIFFFPDPLYPALVASIAAKL